MNLHTASTPQLLRQFGDVLTELRRRGAIRSTNNPVADYAEYLVSRALHLQLAAKSTTGYDATDASGLRYEIKGRRVTAHNSSTQLSAIRGLDAEHFHYLAGVLFREDFSVLRACLVPFATVSATATYRKRVNAWVLHLRPSLWDVPGVIDITSAVGGVVPPEDMTDGPAQHPVETKSPAAAAPNKWTVQQDLAALYVYKFGPEKVGGSVAKVADALGIAVGSFRMRVANYRALDGGGGLTNASKQTRQVYDDHSNLAEPDLRALAFPTR